MPRQEKDGVSKGKCLIPDCGKEAMWKGLCRSCYGQALHIIDTEGESWENLQEMGLCINDEKPFKRAYREAKDKRTHEFEEDLGDTKGGHS